MSPEPRIPEQRGPGPWPHTLRPIEPGDYAAVAGLTVAAYAPYIPAGSEYLDLLADVEARASAAEIVVAEIAGAVVGAIVLAGAGSALAEIARITKSGAFIRTLMNAASPEEVVELFRME